MGAGFVAKVVGVTDGDTITVLHDGAPEKIRLNGIDCPEKSQAFGTKAKTVTSFYVFGKSVKVEPTGKDRYGRTLAEVFLPDGRSLNHQLLKDGLAWWFRKYSSDRTLEALADEARKMKRGLWENPDPVAPWDYRHARSAARKLE